MTATAIPQQSVPARTWNSLLKLAVLLAVAVVLIAGSFALGRGTADDATTVVKQSTASVAAPPPTTPAAATPPTPRPADHGMTQHHRFHGARDGRAPGARRPHRSFVVALPLMGLLERAEQVALVVERFARARPRRAPRAHQRRGRRRQVGPRAGAARPPPRRRPRCWSAAATTSSPPGRSARSPTSPAAGPVRSPTPSRPATSPPCSTPSSPSWPRRRTPRCVVLEDLQWADEATLDLAAVRRPPARLAPLPRPRHPPRRPRRRPPHPARHRRPRRARTSPGSTSPRSRSTPCAPWSATGPSTRCRSTPPPAATPSSSSRRSTPSPARSPSRCATSSSPAPRRSAAPARDALDAAAVLGRHAEAALIQAVADCDAAALDECLHAGLLVDDDGVQAFRHDLIRQAVEESMTPAAAPAAARPRPRGARRRRRRRPARPPRHRRRRRTPPSLDLAWPRPPTTASPSAPGARPPCSTARPSSRAPTTSERRPPPAPRGDRPPSASASSWWTRRWRPGDGCSPLLEAEGELEELAEWEAVALPARYRAVGRGEEAAMPPTAPSRGSSHLGRLASPALAALATLTGHLLVTGRFDECIETSPAGHRAGGALRPRGGRRLRAQQPRRRARLASADEEGVAAAARVARPGQARRPPRRRRPRRQQPRLHAHRPLQPALALPVLDEGIAACRGARAALPAQLPPARAGPRCTCLLGEWDAAAADLAAVLDDPYASPINRAIVLAALGPAPRPPRRSRTPSRRSRRRWSLPGRSTRRSSSCPMHLARAEAAWFDGDLGTAAARRRGVPSRSRPLLDALVARASSP